jgi:hypothetical protein
MSSQILVKIPSGRKSGVRGVFSAILVLLGAAMIVRTAIAGGGLLAFGYVVGSLLVLVGALRLYLSRESWLGR